MTTFNGPIDCACVIHGDVYDWQYVERLYNMLTRNITGGLRFHVYTEEHRPVPDHMIKHSLELWSGVNGPRRSWWYKLQLFNPAHHQGNLLYFDLDMVIIKNLDWIKELDPRKFWAIRDFTHLQRPSSTTLNSSMMWWNVPEYSKVWHNFIKTNVDITTRKYPGDQDYITAHVDRQLQRHFPEHLIKSYRWQSLDGGYNFKQRAYRSPGTGVTVDPDVSVLVFHGNPKPHLVRDPLILQHWV